MLLSTSTKIEKNKNLKFYTKIMYLAPHLMSGNNVCPHSSAGCRSNCLVYSGHGRINKVQAARINRTKFFYDDRKGFIEQLEKEIRAFTQKTPTGMKPALRLNGYSDLPLEVLMPNIFSSFPKIQFYDYTKSFRRMKKFIDGKMPDNYYLTFSRSENNEKQCKEVLKLGYNVAVVFRDRPKTFWGYKVVDFDDSDCRFLDERPVVGALSPKGKAKHDTSGFVI